MLKKLFQILSFIAIFNLISNDDYYDENIIYNFKVTNPVTLQLSSGNVILFTNEGIYLLDTNFRKIDNYTFSVSSLNSNNDEKKTHPSITVFPPAEDGIILCLISNKEFYFNNVGILISIYNIETLDETNTFISNYVINSFKKEALDYYYTITYYDYGINNGGIKIFYYKLNYQSSENNLIDNISYSNEAEVLVESTSITCQRTKSNINEKYLTCFYQYTSFGKYYITEITFEPDKSFSHIEPKINYPIEDGEPGFYYSVSVSNEDYSRVYVCYTAEGKNGICFYYDINQRKFSKRYILGNECRGNSYFFNLNYFSQTKEFIFSCSPNNKFVYSIVKFNDEMNMISPSGKGEYNILENCFSSNGFLILYSLKSSGYLLLTNNLCDTNENIFKIKSYELSNYFNSSKIIITSSELNIDKLTTNIDMPNILSTVISKPIEISIPTKISDSSKIKTDIPDISSTIISKPTEISITTEIIENRDSSKIKTDIPDILSTIISKPTEISDSSKISELIQTIETISTKISNEINESSKITESTYIKKSNEITTSVDLNNESSEVMITNEVISSTGLIDTKQTDEITKEIEIKKSTEVKELIDLTEKLTEKSKNTHDIVKDNNCKDKNMIINTQGNCVCDNKNSYYPLKINNIIHYNECYNNESKPENFYFNKEQYEICYKFCKTCNFHGNEDENNCTQCIDEYIFTPDNNNTVNCVPKCNYYYYFNMFELYSCTLNYQCPTEANLLIRKKNKCIDSCSKDNKYKYQYSGECYEKCPDDTITNGYKCEVKNPDSCSLSVFKLNLTFNDLIEQNIDFYGKNYVEEFNYTNNQIVNYTNKEYSLVFYKNSYCIKELSLTIPKIDFGECYNKIKLHYNISEDLLIAILDKYIENRNPITTYFFFNPENGEKLNVSEICKNEVIIINEKILTFPGVDSSLVQFFADQNINVFNISDKFYSDICQHYKSPNGRDIPLKLRLQIFFPNISLCDKGCLSKGVDIKTMDSICHCLFSDFTKNSFLENAFEYTGNLGDMYEFISNSNFDILFCISNIFNYEYFKRCIGGYIIMSLIFFQSIEIIIYLMKSKIEMKKYIFNISNLYIQYKNIKNNPPKRSFKARKSLNLSTNKKKRINKKLDLSSSIIKMNIKEKSKTKVKKPNIYLSKFTNKIIIQNISNRKNINKNLKKKNKDKIYLNDYLLTDPDEMDYEDVLERDKRTFCQYFCDNIKNKQLIVNTFFITSKLKPKSIKIMAFILYINFIFLINGLIYSEAYLIELYNNDRPNYSVFNSTIFENLIYVFIIVNILNEIIDFFFIKEKKIKGILIRGKNRFTKIQGDIFLLIKKIEIYYNTFIILSYLILIFSWIYISCFNDIYIYTRIDWIKKSIIFFFLIQIFLICIYFIETIIRFISICCQSEKLFKLSKYLN